MPIIKGQTKLKAIHKGTTNIVRVYKGTKLLAGYLPSTFQRVEYIESTGTQYIDTNVLVKNATGIAADILFTNQADQIFIGRQSCMQLGSNNGFIYFGWNGINTLSGDRPYAIDVKHNYKLNYKNNRKALLDDLEDPNYVLDFATLETTTQYPITIFCRHETNGNKLYFSSIQLYSLRITDGETVIRDFIPCYRKADSVIGLYDVVNGVFYTNSGTGTFLKGSDI